MYHADESKFRDAAVFSPERWLGDGFAEMDRNMVSFSRGSRGCLGIKYVYSVFSSCTSPPRHSFLCFPTVIRSLPFSTIESKAQHISYILIDICSLAYAELHLVFAHLFRRFDLLVHETTAADMEWGDYFVTIPRGHLKVMVQEAE